MDAKLYGTWEFANLCRQANHWGTFVAACADDPERAREARQLVEQAFASDPTSFYAVRQIVQRLEDWAAELADHPHRPPDPRPDEVDRQARAYVNDLLCHERSADTRNKMAGLRLSLDVTFEALRRTLNACTREDASYLYGRATMALDFGDFISAERELVRLQELKKAHGRSEPKGHSGPQSS